ncbi:hypothetical protein CHLNCDRAFT_34835 [Chlorella variabilis]|uniref:Uncharacterized protein n=1 Tax=Chlorella variabilis TaxID=554065 RepID=E1ZAZ0_CHLVA|nr:hypothetical protein CHLNCDRAFT_34835 [Chlorella variabilis]EFN57136.1 hypothetical protein CHLNCDRAFT_34835 [Chlorella variabilis]|eukprot:XP_005849238.1 hypothetical protein CHLNCDRAFT_34835 [Chlorella variabilis]
MQLGAGRQVSAAPVAGPASRLPCGLGLASPRHPWPASRGPLTHHQRRRQLRVAVAGGPGQQPEEAPERPAFPAAAAAVRRQQIQRERAAIRNRIENLVATDFDEEDAALIDLVGDEFKEADRKNLRTVFDFDRWKKHRSGSRYMRHARATFTSRITQGLAAPLLYVTGLSIAVASWHTAAEVRWAGPMGILSPIPELKIDTTFSLTSFALSLLLAYRTNAGYGRWDEARKMWGLVVNRSRDMTRQVGARLAGAGQCVHNIFITVCTCSRSLMCHLRGGEDIESELAGVLTPRELDALKASAHRPNYCVQVRGRRVARGSAVGGSLPPLPPAAASPQDVTGGCERILRTPIPLSYTRHTSRFMMIWLTVMPFTLWDAAGWAMVPLAMTVAFLLLGIEEIGVMIEEPFSVLPLEVISRTIEGNVRELERAHGLEAAAMKEREAALAAARDGGGAAAPAAPADGQVDALDLVLSILPEEELRQPWGPGLAMLSGTAGPATVPAGNS